MGKDGDDRTREELLRENARLKRLLDQNYNELLMRHYSTRGKNVLAAGHSNLATNEILEIIDYRNSGVWAALGTNRERFFENVAQCIPDAEEKAKLLSTFNAGAAKRAFEEGTMDLRARAYMKLPRFRKGMHVQFRSHLVEEPITGDLMAILTITDVTDLVIRDRLMYQLAVGGFDSILDVDLQENTQKLIIGNTQECNPGFENYREYLNANHDNRIIAKDRARVQKMLQPEYIMKRLEKTNAYSVPYSIYGRDGHLRAKSLYVTAPDLRLGRICMAEKDVTNTRLEQKRLLQVISYTFDKIDFVDAKTGHLSEYTRRMIVENLPPLELNDYPSFLAERAVGYELLENGKTVQEEYTLENVIRNLKKKPEGYEMIALCAEDGALRYKKIVATWGERIGSDICLVRADVTDMVEKERKDKETLENALRSAKEANNAKSTFLFNMSHDLRTPMNAIIGFAALAESQMDDLDYVKECMDKISRSSDVLLGIINDTLDMARIESGKLRINPSPTDLREVVRNLQDMFQGSMRESEINFEVEQEFTHPVVNCDHLRLSQICINLLGNARKFTGPGGNVWLKIKQETPDAEGNTVLTLCVKDTGMGMSPDFMPHIFEAFERERSPETSKIQGTGLGLSIVKRLVELMEGSIEVESTQGEGSEFILHFVLKTAQMPKMKEDSPVEMDFAGMRVLLVEDNDLNREIAEALLTRKGFLVDSVSNGADAVDQVRTNEAGAFALVLMDIQMPIMDGYDAARAIRALPDAGRADVPIVAITANAFEEDRRKCFEAGMDGHITKPLRVNELTRQLGEILAKKGMEEGNKNKSVASWMDNGVK